MPMASKRVQVKLWSKKRSDQYSEEEEEKGKTASAKLRSRKALVEMQGKAEQGKADQKTSIPPTKKASSKWWNIYLSQKHGGGEKSKKRWDWAPKMGKGRGIKGNFSSLTGRARWMKRLLDLKKMLQEFFDW
uniref:Uncharacterized protein n=1 Tax=Coccolithus braarudii TaxID=221442 RepID=A0A7S0LAC3_9EUKA|mmetsp:Transcript_26284/g.56728  ORF Transcript_26284/g.56728 Transcript_26284/m.56728 type:complete len:132 (+) Transcript_26284:123-518(+)